MLLFTRTAARSTRSIPRVSHQARALHVENTVNNNFPFKYEKKRSFLVKSSAFMGFAFALPFAAVQFKKYKQ